MPLDQKNRGTKAAQGREGQIILWQVALTYIGAVVGAGFASGQELLKFFVAFGPPGIIGAALSGLLLGIFGLMVIKLADREKMAGYYGLLRFLFGKRLAFFFDGVTSVFLFLTLAIMLVAGSSLLQQLWGLPLWVGYFCTTALVYCALLADLKGVFWLNTALLPGLILLTLATAILSLISGGGVVGANEACEAVRPVSAVLAGLDLNFVGGYWWWAVGLYVSYNFVLGAVVLSSLGHTAANGGKAGVMLGGLILGLMAAVISLALFRQGGGQITEAMPMLVLAAQLHPWVGGAYSLALWVAIITTALAIGLGLLKRVQQFCAWTRWRCLLLIFLPTLPFVYWSFPQMVAVIYPVMGYLGFAFLFAILLKNVKH